MPLRETLLQHEYSKTIQMNSFYVVLLLKIIMQPNPWKKYQVIVERHL